MVENRTAGGMQEAIRCEQVWKIFGARTQEALRAAREQNIEKDEILRRYDCVLGVADVTFTVSSGEIFCIMGLSGSGKSTLVRHVNRLVEPTVGRILIHGEDIGVKTESELRRLRAERIGMVFQHMALLPHRTIRENVAFGLEVRRVDRRRRAAVAEEKLDLVKLGGWGDRYPDELSGGMQQRVGLARALAADPDILLMDEPFSALDPLIRRELQGQFLELSSVMRKTTLFITHDLDEAIRLGDRIAIMKDGRFSQIGTPEDIVTRPIDKYVADFVSGISRLKLVHAKTVMEPYPAFAAANPMLMLAAAPTVGLGADLDALISGSVQSDLPVVVLDEEGKPVGVVTKQRLLRSIQGQD